MKPGETMKYIRDVLAAIKEQGLVASDYCLHWCEDDYNALSEEIGLHTYAPRKESVRMGQIVDDNAPFLFLGIYHKKMSGKPVITKRSGL